MALGFGSIVGLEAAIGFLDDKRTKVSDESIKAAREVATYILHRIQESAPVDTGGLRDSWQQKDLKYGAQVYTNHPAAHRIEWGFIGTDSIGRSYHEPPDPYIKPSMSGSGGLLTDKIESFFK